VGLNVAMVTTWKVRCGIATYSESLVNALAKLGVSVYVVRVSRFGKKTTELLQNVVETIPVDKVDVVHVQHEYGIWQGLERDFYLGLKNLGKPIVTTMHATGVSQQTDNGIAMTSDRVIVHNKYCAQRFGYPAVIIPHGAKPCETIPADEAKRSCGFDPRIPIVGYCGFISSYKGLEQLIEAMVKIPKAALLIAGGWHVQEETEYITQLKERSLAILSKRCQWVGYVPDAELSKAYGAMDIVVYPSRFATESGALITALSHGKAVVASDLPPFKEKEKLSALTTFKTVRDLRRKIRRLLKDVDERRRLEEGAKRYSRENSWNEVSKRHIQVYQEAIKSDERNPIIAQRHAELYKEVLD